MIHVHCQICDTASPSARPLSPIYESYFTYEDYHRAYWFICWMYKYKERVIINSDPVNIEEVPGPTDAVAARCMA